MLSSNQQLMFAKFYFGELSSSQFEDWLYLEATLEGKLDETQYLNLISHNFQKNSGLQDILKIIEDIYSDYSETTLEGDFSKWVATVALSGSMTLIKAIEYLSMLGRKYENVDPVFSGYHSEIQRRPEDLEYYRARILADIRKLCSEA